MPQHIPQPLGVRIAKHRAELGWTQADLAERVGISRVAVSHLEAGISTPGERTVALLAGVFKLEPHDLVDGTDYPPAKSERLPGVAARYTEVEHQLALLDALLAHAGDAQARAVIAADARVSLTDLLHHTHDRRERELLTARLRTLGDDS